MNKIKRFALLGIAVLGLSSMTPLSACTSISKIDDSTYFVVDGWGKADCITWAIKNSEALGAWACAAYMDGENFC